MELPDNFWTPAESYADKLASGIAADMERKAMLASEKFDRDLEQHKAIMNIDDNSGQTAQTVVDIDQRLSVLNRRVEDLERGLKDAKREIAEANEKASKDDKRYNLLIALFGAVTAEGLAMLIAWLMK